MMHPIFDSVRNLRCPSMWPWLLLWLRSWNWWLSGMSMPWPLWGRSPSCFSITCAKYSAYVRINYHLKFGTIFSGQGHVCEEGATCEVQVYECIREPCPQPEAVCKFRRITSSFPVTLLDHSLRSCQSVPSSSQRRWMSGELCWIRHLCGGVWGWPRLPRSWEVLL